VSLRGTVVGDERLRLFLALRLPADVLDALVEWEAALDNGRRVPRDNLHVTLAFLGHRPAAELPAVCDALGRAAAAARPPLLSVERYRETRSVGMLVLADEDERAQALARDLHGRLERLAVYEPEKRPWVPHVTVLRFRQRPKLRPELPEIAPFAPSDAAAYLSRPSRFGARYDVVDAFPLGG
jgi:2'-5' RNA ligase